MGITPVFCVRTLVVAAVSLVAIAPVSGQVTTLTFDRLHWYDRVGNPHRVQSLNIELYEQDLTDSTLLITNPTGRGDEAGYLEFGTTTTDFWDDSLELYTQVRTEIPGIATIGPEKDLVSDPDIFLETDNRMPAGTALWSVPEGGSLSLPENPAQTLSIPGASSTGNATAASQSIGVLQVVKFAHDYFYDSLGATVAPVSMQLYATSTGYSSSRNNYIDVDDNRWGSDARVHGRLSLRCARHQSRRGSAGDGQNRK